MLKQFLASTAIVAVMAGTAAVAQSNTTDAQQQQQTQMQQQPAASAGGEVAENREMLGENELLASEFIGMSVYNSTADDAEEIATIEDVLMSQDGQIASVVLNTGGFFGLGGNDYLIPMDRLEIAKRDGEFWITSDIQKAELEGMTVFVAERPSEDADMQQTAQAPAAQTGAAPMTGQAAEQAADANRQDMAATDTQTEARTENRDMAASSDTSTTATTENRDMAQSNDTAADSNTVEETAAIDNEPIDESLYTTEADVEALTAENLMDVTVVGANNENVGDVEDILLTPEGKIEAMVIDVGGFLGIGGKEVAVAFKDLDIRQNEDGDLVLFTKFTEEKLEGAAEYDEAAYQQDPTAIVVNPND